MRWAGTHRGESDDNVTRRSEKYNLPGERSPRRDKISHQQAFCSIRADDIVKTIIDFGEAFESSALTFGKFLIKGSVLVGNHREEFGV